MEVTIPFKSCDSETLNLPKTFLSGWPGRRGAICIQPSSYFTVLEDFKATSILMQMKSLGGVCGDGEGEVSQDNGSKCSTFWACPTKERIQISGEGRRVSAFEGSYNSNQGSSVNCIGQSKIGCTESLGLNLQLKPVCSVQKKKACPIKFKRKNNKAEMH